jgi:peptidyl-prolyl cis-trans isomerase C
LLALFGAFQLAPAAGRWFNPPEMDRIGGVGLPSLYESTLHMSDEIQASHILVATDSKSKEDALAQITEIKEKIDGGESFADLAKEHSDCPSGRSGGDLGSFGRGMMVPEFEQAAFALDADGISDVVETNFGYHLIQRTA